MAETKLISFRPKKEFMEDFDQILEWCSENNMTFSTVMNALLPAIAYSLTNTNFRSNGKVYMRADWGDIFLPVPQHLPLSHDKKLQAYLTAKRKLNNGWIQPK